MITSEIFFDYLCNMTYTNNKFNVVDGQLNAKLADLELGADSIDQGIDDSPFQKDFLVNWVPPEVFCFFF